MNERHDAATVAADWWAQKILRNERHDNGDRSGASALAMALADFGREPVTAAQIKTFKAAVVKGIEEYPSREGVDIYCDY